MIVLNNTASTSVAATAWGSNIGSAGGNETDWYQCDYKTIPAKTAYLCVLSDDWYPNSTSVKTDGFVQRKGDPEIEMDTTGWVSIR